MKRKEIIFSITALAILLTACLTLNAKSVQAAQAGETIEAVRDISLQVDRVIELKNVVDYVE